MSSIRKRDRGQALVEFALVFPIFAILIFGIIDIGRLVYTANALNNGAREGARVGSVVNRPTECNGLTRKACSELIARNRTWGVSTSAVTATAKCFAIAGEGGAMPEIPMTDCGINDLITVQTQSQFTLVTPLIAQLIGIQTVRGEARMAVNQ